MKPTQKTTLQRIAATTRRRLVFLARHRNQSVPALVASLVDAALRADGFDPVELQPITPHRAA